VEAIEGLGEACAFFDAPITGGNVSLYNETLGEAIFPTPVVGIIGLMKAGAPVTIDFKNPGRAVVLLGGIGSSDEIHFGGTQYAKQILHSLWGLPPALDMDYEKRVQSAVREIVNSGLAESAHDLSDGGLAVALVESSAKIGAQIDLESDLRPELLLFHEGPSRVLISTAEPAKVQEIARKYGVEAPEAGVTIRERVVIRNRDTPLIDCDIVRLQNARNSALGRMLHGR
jgi:phosphoribosylformylglycinamidine (FGAM) synthase-like enzyme